MACSKAPAAFKKKGSMQAKMMGAALLKDAPAAASASAAGAAVPGTITETIVETKTVYVDRPSSVVEKEVIKEVEVGYTFLSSINQSINSSTR